LSFKTASAILRGNWLVEPEYAKAQLPIVLQMIKGDAAINNNKILHFENNTDVNLSIPIRQKYSAAQSDVFIVNPYTSTDRLPYGSIAMIDVIGPILKYGERCSYGTVDQNNLLLKLGSSDRVKGILLNVDSPGGQADGTGMFADTIKMVSKSKPIISVVQDGYAASAGMWIAAAAQEVYATRATDSFGSIGAYTTIYDFTEYFALNGIKITDIYAPQSSDKNKAYKDALAGDTSLIENDLKFLVEDFKASVSSSRGARLKVKGDEPFTGKMYNAKEALRMGLIDGIKPMSGVIKRLEELIALRA
jgi:protease IV